MLECHTFPLESGGVSVDLECDLPGPVCPSSINPHALSRFSPIDQHGDTNIKRDVTAEDSICCHTAFRAEQMERLLGNVLRSIEKMGESIDLAINENLYCR